MSQVTTQRPPHRLQGRTLWIPRMTYSGARLTASAFRSAGIDARVTPESDDLTLELGGLHCSGQECYPEKITLGDFLRIIHADDFDPDATAFFMPTAEGPCRFGQYAPYLKLVLRQLGHEDVPVVTPTSANSYDGLGDQAPDMVRRVWRGIVGVEVSAHKHRSLGGWSGSMNSLVIAVSAGGQSGLHLSCGMFAEFFHTDNHGCFHGA